MTVMPQRILTVALVAAPATIGTRCASTSEMMRTIDWPVLLVIASALGIGEAMKNSGLAADLVGSVLSIAGNNLGLVLLVTMLFTNLINADAAAALMFPTAVGAAAGLRVSALPFAIAIMVGAAASFITSIGYQTNLMVYGPGGVSICRLCACGVAAQCPGRLDRDGDHSRGLVLPIDNESRPSDLNRLIRARRPSREHRVFHRRAAPICEPLPPRLYIDTPPKH